MHIRYSIAYNEYSTLGGSDLARLAIFENEHIAVGQVHFRSLIPKIVASAAKVSISFLHLQHTHGNTARD